MRRRVLFVGGTEHGKVRAVPNETIAVNFMPPARSGFGQRAAGLLPLEGHAPLTHYVLCPFDDLDNSQALLADALLKAGFKPG